MAGSYNHVVKNDGSLRSSARVQGMLECFSGDVFEAVEEMYGMIWYLSTQLDNELAHKGPGTVEELIEEARKNYKVGLEQSPTKRYKER